MPMPPRTTTPKRSVLALVAFLTGCSASQADRTPAEAHTTTASGVGAAPQALALLSSDCQRCHARAHTEWATSAHASAFVGAGFQASWQRTRAP
jgi:hypothetical protein